MARASTVESVPSGNRFLRLNRSQKNKALGRIAVTLPVLQTNAIYEVNRTVLDLVLKAFGPAWPSEAKGQNGPDLVSHGLVDKVPVSCSTGRLGISWPDLTLDDT